MLKFKQLCNRASHLILYGHDDETVLSDTSEGISQFLFVSFRVFKFIEYISDAVNNHSNLVLIGNWLLLKPAGYDCPSEDLEKEVVQLGLPPEHGNQLRKVYEVNKAELMEKVKNSVHKGNLLSQN